jgi:hypothetical protein
VDMPFDISLVRHTHSMGPSQFFVYHTCSAITFPCQCFCHLGDLGYGGMLDGA